MTRPLPRSRNTVGLLLGLAGALVSVVAKHGSAPGLTIPQPRPLGMDQGCTVQVRFSDVGKGFYHAYILTLDHRGASHFRAGPANPGPAAERVWAFLGWKRTAARSWGPLRAEHGPYLPGTVDYDSGDPPTMTIVRDGAPCGIYNLRLTGAEISVNSAAIPYNPATTNSNAFVRYALGWIHVVPGAPPVRAPGWFTILAAEAPSLLNGEGRKQLTGRQGLTLLTDSPGGWIGRIGQDVIQCRPRGPA